MTLPMMVPAASMIGAPQTLIQPVVPSPRWYRN
jgi:hypothetical protein